MIYEILIAATIIYCNSGYSDTTNAPDTTVYQSERPLSTVSFTSLPPETSYSPETSETPLTTNSFTSLSPETTDYQTERPLTSNSFTSLSPETTYVSCDLVSAERICEEEIGCDCCSFNKNEWLNECKDKVCSIEKRCLKREYNSVSDCCIGEKPISNQFSKMCDKYCIDDGSSMDYGCDLERANNDCINNICGECMGSGSSNYNSWLSECSNAMCKWNRRCDRQSIYDFSECMDEYEGIELRFNRIYKRNCKSHRPNGGRHPEASEEILVEKSIPEEMTEEAMTEDNNSY